MRLRFVCFLLASCLSAQQYDLVLKGGHVIDPANSIDGVFDVAVSGNSIASVAPNLSGKRTLDVSGKYVVPGLVDLHAHVFGYDGALAPDATSLPTGATTVVDAGGSGWRTFDEFRRKVISTAKTRVLVDLNIVGKGMVGEPAESDTEDMDSAKTADMIKRNRDVIVGIKTAHFGGKGWTAIDRAVEAGRQAGVPVMVDDKIFTDTGRTTREKVLAHLRPGDIHTHMYNDRQVELISRFNGKVQPYMWEARQRGVLFDLGHGAGSFLWPVASKAMAQGFMPDTISTDLHEQSIMVQESDMPNCMSKLMLLGMSLQDAVLRSTVNPAKAIHQYPKIGTLGVGQGADIAVLELQTGVFAFKDAWGAKRLGTKRLENVLTVRDGQVVYERAAAPPTTEARIYDILIRNAGKDIGFASKKMVNVGSNVRASQARILIDATGYEVKPALKSPQPQPDYVEFRNCMTDGGPNDLAIFDHNLCILTIRNGAIVWDHYGLAAPDWVKAGPYSNFK